MPEPTFGFNRRDARDLLRLRDAMRNAPGAAVTFSGPTPTIMLEASIARSPGGGIPARSGTTLGSATCDLYRIESGALVTRKQSDGTTVATATVYNLSATAVAASVYIGVVRIDGVWVCNWEDCT